MGNDQSVGLRQAGRHMVVVYDTGNGNARLLLSSVSAKEFMSRDPARYVETLSPGQVAGPLIRLENVMMGN